MAQHLSRTGKALSSLVDERIKQFPSSGEINRRVGDVQGAIAAVKQRYVPGSVKVENVDGLSVEHPRWRFNLRSSNTEPLCASMSSRAANWRSCRRRTDGDPRSLVERASSAGKYLVTD